MNLNQITVPSLDLTKSIPFYQSLGLTLIVHSNNDYARFECTNGASFSLHRVDLLPKGEGIWVYFELGNLDEEVKQLMAKGILFDSTPKDERWLWREARLRDLDGNQLVLYSAKENRLNPPWRLND